jgi:hypothetical protein
MPDYPKDIQIYKQSKPDIDFEYVKTLGKKFGLSGTITMGPENYLMQDEDSDASLMVYLATGTIDYEVSSELYPKETPVLPLDEEAKQIAMSFLSEKGLLPEGEIASKVSVGGTSNGVPAHLLVGFTNNIKVSGAGAKHGVRIGDHGKVVAAFISPTNFEPAGTEKLKPVEQAYEELKKTRRQFTGIDTYWISIDSVTVKYW